LNDVVPSLVPNLVEQIVIFHAVQRVKKSIRQRKYFVKPKSLPTSMAGEK
jgi:hypothetical protein